MNILSVNSVKILCLHAVNILNGVPNLLRKIIDLFFNNKQKLSTDSVRKEVVKTFKKRQMEVINVIMNCNSKKINIVFFSFFSIFRP